mgnify:CR=1 FL=1
MEFRDPDAPKYEEITKNIHIGLAEFLDPYTQIYSDVSSSTWSKGLLNSLGYNTHGQKTLTPT